VDNTTENYNFFTKNYIPWRNIKSSIYSQKILKREIEKTNIIKEFYTNSDTIIKDFVKTVNLASTNYKTIIFITGRCFPNLSRQANFLRKKGFKTFLICMEQMTHVNFEMVENSFDRVLQNCCFYPTLDKILNSVSPNFFHIQCWMWEYSLGKFVIDKKLRSKVICDFYDVTGMYANYDNLKIAFEEYSIKQDLECEKYIFENADGIIHRYKQSVFVDYAKRYKNNGKILEFQQYPISNPSLNTKSNDKNQKYKFVFCGTLIPPNDKKHPPELFSPAGLIYTFEELLKGGHEINVYLPLNGNREFNNWVFQLNKLYSHTLKIHNFLPVSELIREISSYDFGINYQKIDLNKTKVSKYTFKGAMGTKNHTYLEAGLPVIVNKEFAYHNEIVTKNKIGLSLKSEDLPNLSLLIDKLNINKLKSNVKKFNMKNSLDQKGKDLLSFYESL